MIQANELRLGNYLNHIELGVVRVISISCKIGDFESVFVESLKDGLDYNFNLDEDLFAIPITNEILLKYGFEKSAFNIYTDIYKRYPIELIYNIANGFEYQINGKFIRASSFHQLQNLYFSLRGKELA